VFVRKVDASQFSNVVPWWPYLNSNEAGNTYYECRCSVVENKVFGKKQHQLLSGAIDNVLFWINPVDNLFHGATSTEEK
jgi:hypothetical protein